MRRTVIAGLSIALPLIGCTSVRPAPPESAAHPTAPAPEVQHSTAPDSVAKPSEPPSAAAAAEGQTARTSSPNVNPAAPAAIAPVTPSVEAPVTSSTATSPKTSAHTTPLNPTVSAKQPDASKRAAPPPTADSASLKRPPPPSLDFSSLQQRLRDTHAIGVFTKLSLKNQVDDLLAAFRAYYGGTLKVPLSELRQRYDVLLLKVLTLLQDGDPPLAATISNSKEAIWGILADPQKFATL